VSKNPYLTLTSKRKIKFVGKISTDPDQYMLANPVPFGILALEIFFGYGTLGSGFATGQK
jgi:hypothetical protein